MAKQEATKRAARPPVSRTGAPTRERTKPSQFVKEVIAELRKVAWPTRQEVFAYSLVVIVSVTVIAALIYGMDYLFAQAILSLFGID